MELDEWNVRSDFTLGINKTSKVLNLWGYGRFILERHYGGVIFYYSFYSAFGEKSTMNFNYLLSPFTIYTSINLNKSFRPLEDPYKYQINTLLSQITVNLSPNVVRDILKFQAFLEMFSYSKDLKRFRPPLRL